MRKVKQRGTFRCILKNSKPGRKFNRQSKNKRRKSSETESDVLRILPEKEMERSETRLITLSLEKCVKDEWMEKFIAKERKGGRDRPCAGGYLAML